VFTAHRDTERAQVPASLSYVRASVLGSPEGARRSKQFTLYLRSKSHLTLTTRMGQSDLLFIATLVGARSVWHLDVLYTGSGMQK